MDPHYSMAFLPLTGVHVLTESTVMTGSTTHANVSILGEAFAHRVTPTGRGLEAYVTMVTVKPEVAVYAFARVIRRVAVRDTFTCT